MASEGSMWDYASAEGGPARPYGSDETYRLGLPWLDLVCHTVEDWGAGMAYGRQFISTADYTAIDSSPTARPWVDVTGNLEDRKSSPDGIFMRHILEHNANWPDILDNAVASFTRRMVLVMFTPFTHVTGPTPGRDRLDICFCKEDLTERMGEYLIAELHVATDTQFGGEHLFFLSKEDDEELGAALGSAVSLGAVEVAPLVPA